MHSERMVVLWAMQELKGWLVEESEGGWEGRTREGGLQVLRKKPS